MGEIDVFWFYLDIDSSRVLTCVMLLILITKSALEFNLVCGELRFCRHQVVL